MHLLAGVGGAALLAVVLWDAFETIILPRRVSGRLRLTKLFYRITWPPWRVTAQLLTGRRSDAFLSFYGPLSLILLLALWAAGIVFAFAVLQWAAGSALTVAGGTTGFGSDIYMSGTTFVTLGLGDVAPRSTFAKALTALEAGMGFAFLAVVIGYFPVIYQAFSRREVAISLLDARAGSPPSASELLWRLRDDPDATASLTELLADWERWAADVLESHLSYPPLAYFRSQHYNESWVAALTTILDTCAAVTAATGGRCGRQAELTFAMARHAVVDLAQVFSTPPRQADDRLPAAQLAQLRERLAAGLKLEAPPHDFGERVAELRRMYEPYVVALARHLALPLPPWVRERERPDNWQTSAWDRVVKVRARAPGGAGSEEHF
jgi:ion channel